MYKRQDAAEAVHVTKRNKLIESEEQLATCEEEVPDAEADVQQKQADLDEAQTKLDEMLRDVQGEVCCLPQYARLLGHVSAAVSLQPV